MPFQTIFQELVESEGAMKAIAGGGADSGLGHGYMANTLTSFNVSAIANPMSIESPHGDGMHPYEHEINAQEKHELYQEVI